MSNTKTAFLNGEFIPEAHASLHISDLSVQRGYGVFDFFRVINDTPVFMNDHLDRFFHSAAGLGLNLNIDKESITQLVHELIDRNKMGFSGIKLTLTGGYSPTGYDVIEPNFFITQHGMLPRPADAIKLSTYDHVRELPQVKSINYITGLMLHTKRGVADVLYCRNNEVSELPRSSFFIVTKEDVVTTAANNVLSGITRKKILELANQSAETIITLDDLRNAKEAFITSTSKQVQPVLQVNDIVIGNGKPGPITKSLDEQFQSLLPQ